MQDLTSHIALMDEGIAHVARALPALPAVEARLGRLLLMVGASLDAVLVAELKPYQLNHSEFLALMFLYSQPDGRSTPSELCACTSQGATNMTRIANTLAKRGLITRGIGSGDRRRIEIRLTPAGKRFVRKILPPLFPHMQAMFEGFSAGETARLDRLLRKLAANIDRLAARQAA